jgi:hypothetical protein
MISTIAKVETQPPGDAAEAAEASSPGGLR